jgi:hypothetical protein
LGYNKKEDKMKNLVLIILVLVGLSYSAVPSVANLANGYSVQLDSVFKTGTNPDTLTLTNAGDTVVIATALKLNQGEGFRYILNFAPFTGSSPSVGVFVYTNDINGNVTSRTAIDTISTNFGRFIQIPLGYTLMGNSYTIKLAAITTNTLIVRRVSLWKAKVIDAMKGW